MTKAHFILFSKKIIGKIKNVWKGTQDHLESLSWSQAAQLYRNYMIHTYGDKNILKNFSYERNFEEDLEKYAFLSMNEATSLVGSFSYLAKAAVLGRHLLTRNGL